jgi:hypothetical protein
MGYDFGVRLHSAAIEKGVLRKENTSVGTNLALMVL